MFLINSPDSNPTAIVSPQPMSMETHQLFPREFFGWRLSRAEERANAITHGLGLLLSVAGAVAMVTYVLGDGDVWRQVGCTVYVASLIAVYAMSTLSHSATTPEWRSYFRALDQGCIYLLIAATYTPFSLVYLRTAPWWLLLGAIWSIALWGFLSKVVFSHRVESVALWPCILLGWMPTISVPALAGIVPVAAFWWMLVGGICYSVGTIFLRYDYKVRHFHAVWHVMVIAGSTCHFLAIFSFVAHA
jgi:hemolysin III